MFRVKICGITTQSDAQAAVAAGADAIGVNFCTASPRYVPVAGAAAIVGAVPSHVQRVGVFVNAPVRVMVDAARQLTLDYIQLHGDEPPDTVAALAPCPVVRAFRWRGDHAAVCDYLLACREAGQLPAAILLDAYAADQYGGTGQTVNWEQVRSLQEHLGALPLGALPVVLAGGLCPENVAAAIRQAGPAAVDVASGVESSPGCKDPDRMRRFVERARHAWQSPGEG
ncbi:MAG: phosphoribosylanthranilate isomerase [Pirellulaceae bacterium]|nr:phosphoribosylanthranilate isomerase [Pirellulaceae bacterium]